MKTLNKMSLIKIYKKPIAGIAVVNTVMFLLIVGIAFIFDLPGRAGWRFHLFIFLSYAITSALWAVLMVVIVKRITPPDPDADTIA